MLISKYIESIRYSNVTIGTHSIAKVMRISKNITKTIVFSIKIFLSNKICDIEFNEYYWKHYRAALLVVLKGDKRKAKIKHFG